LKVWDLPTRLFHWLIVLVVGFSWYSAETGMREWHYRSGIAALGLLAFRLVWGFAGGSTARFTHFLQSPQGVLRHLRRPADPSTAGHNPLGGYSVVAMLAALITQVVSGLFAVDVDGLESGPLSYLISFDQGRAAAEVHEIAFTVIQVLVLLHILAIIYYRLRGRRLLIPMITGRDAQVSADGQAVSGGGPIRAVVALVAASTLAWWISAGAPL
jgi:cytochrome b